MENAAYKYAWNLPKIVLPVGRMSRGPWRFAAAIDIEGRVVGRSFYAVWPRTGTLSVHTLAALLNSPVAQAFVYCHISDRNLLVKVYEAIPIPKIETLLQQDQTISSLVNRYLGELQSDKSKAYQTLLAIDAEILKLYHLPPKLERQLMDIFWGQKRDVPFEFKGYIPPEMTSWVPLHIYLSNAFHEGTVEKILGRIPSIKDNKFIDYLKGLGTE